MNVPEPLLVPLDLSQLMWSSYSTPPMIIPASALFYATPISGSPYDISVVPGAATYPYSEAFGEGLVNASAGVPASFVIQTKVCTIVESRVLWLGRNTAYLFFSTSPLGDIPRVVELS